MLISAIKIFEFTLKKINQHKIDRVYVFNGRFCNSGAVAQAAQFLNCELYFHERGATKEKYFLENFMPHDTIKMQNLMIQTWKNAIRENSQEAIKTARKFFIDSKDKKEIGWIALNKNQHSGLIPNLDNSKKNITYFSSCDDEFAALPHLLPWKFWNNQMDAVLDLIDICKNNPNISLYIRLHPHLGQKSNEDLQKWLNLSRFKHVNIISPFEAIDSHKLAAESALVITSGSTMGIESVFQGTPCIVLGPSFYSELNATYHPESKAQLIKLMNAKLEAVPTKTYPFGYFYMTFGSSFNFFEPIDLFSGTFLNNTLLDEIPKPTLIDKIFKFFLAKPK